MQIINGESYTYDTELTVVLNLGDYSTRTDFPARTGSPWRGTQGLAIQLALHHTTNMNRFISLSTIYRN